MFGPGEYRLDPSEGITVPADLPPPEIVPYSRNNTRQPCPRCGHSAYRDKQSHRTLHDLGNLDGWCPRELVVTYSQHYCTQCRKYFSADLSDLAPPGSRKRSQGGKGANLAHMGSAADRTHVATQISGIATQRITSVAWKRRGGGIVRPRALAVLRLMTRSNCVGCSTGNSSGLAPFRMRST